MKKGTRLGKASLQKGICTESGKVGGKGGEGLLLKNGLSNNKRHKRDGGESNQPQEERKISGLWRFVAKKQKMENRISCVEASVRK